MKKYFLKITSLVITTIPLVTIVACNSKTQDNKGTISNSLTLEQVKAKFTNAESAKMKYEITLPGDGASKTLKTDAIGYRIPKGIPSPFTIAYTLKDKTMWDAENKFQVTVTITKGTEKDTKDIWIKATPYDFGPAKEKLKNNIISTKNKADLIQFIDAKDPNYKFINNDLNAIGYAPPELDDGVRITEYKLGDKTQLSSHGEFELKITLAKGSEKAEHTVKIIPLYDFGPAKNLFAKDSTSTKTKYNINILNADANKELQPAQIGYTPPKLDDEIKAKYTLNSTFDENDIFQVKIVLKKGSQISKPFFLKIKAAYDFDSAEVLMKDAESSKTKNEINLPDSDATDQTVTADQIGYKEPKLPDGVKIVKYTLKSSWDANDKLRVVVTLQKGDKKATKVIVITAKTYDFSDALRLIVPTTSTKMKSEFTTTSPLSPLNTIASDLKAIGYTKPAGSPDGVEFTYKIISPGWKTSPNANKFDVVFILKVGIHESKPKRVEIQAKQFSMDAAKDLFKDAKSSKTKTEINDNISIATDQTVTADQIGYNAPLDPTLAGITLTYKVKSPGWQASPNDNKFDIEVSIQKNGVTQIETITITAKPEEKDLLLEWAKTQFKDVVTSSKMKVQIKLPLATDSDKTLKPSDFGYTKPYMLDMEPSITVEKYLLKRGWGTTDSEKDKFIVTVILKRNVRTATKDIKVQAKAFSLQNAIELFKDATSSKLKGSINLPGSTATDQIVTADEIGYNAPLDPTLAGITLTYTVKSPGWQASPNDNKFEIEVFIKRGNVTKTKIITITAAYDFTSVKDLFGGTEGKVMSSKMKAEMQSLGSKTLKPWDFGYTPPDQEDLPDGVTIEYILKKGWGDTDSEKEKFIVTVILKKGDEIAKKDIQVKATAFSLEKAIKLFRNKRSSKTRKQLIIVLPEPPKPVCSDNPDDPLEDPICVTTPLDLTKNPWKLKDAGAFGYKTPLDIPSDVTLKYWLESTWGTKPWNSDSFKVKVTLKKGDEENTKVIKIIAK